MVKTLRSSSGHREVEKIQAGVSNSCPFWLIPLNWHHLESLYFSLQSVVPSVCLALPFVYSVHGFCAGIGSVRGVTDVFTAQCGVIREITVLFPTKVILIK